MTIRITCPSCDASMTVSEEKRGTKIRCQECDKSIAVPADDENAIQDSNKVAPGAARNKMRRRDADDDDDRAIVGKKSKSSLGCFLLVGGLAALFFVGIVCAGVPLGFMMFGAARHVEIAPPREVAAIDDVPQPIIDPDPKIDPNPLPPIDPNPKPPVIGPEPVKKRPPIQGPELKGKLVLNVNESLRQTDPLVNDARLRQLGARMRVFPVVLNQGREYVISLNSDAFDPYLILEFRGKKVAEDDDSGGDLNARITYRANVTSLHRIVVTSFDGEIGAFRLVVQDISPGDPNVGPIAKKEDPKKDDPFTKKDDPFTKKDDPLTKKDDPFTKKDDPLTKKDDPFTKKDDPLTKKDDPLTKKEDPFTKKDGPITKKDDTFPKGNEFTLKGTLKRPAISVAPTSYLKIVSTPGDYIGQGRSYEYPGAQLVIKKTDRGFQLEVDRWILEIGAAKGKSLAVGEYLNAKRFAFSGDSPGLDFFGQGRGSNKLTGEFVVWEFEANGPQIRRLAVDFVQRSDEKSQPLTGKLRLNSSFE